MLLVTFAEFPNLLSKMMLEIYCNFRCVSLNTCYVPNVYLINLIFISYV